MGERKECSFRNELWFLGARSDRATPCFSGSHLGTRPNGRVCVSALSGLEPKWRVLQSPFWHLGGKTVLFYRG